MGEVITIGLDIAKSVFQAHGVDEAGAVVIRKRVSRAKLLEFFASLQSCLVGIEACPAAHHWSRELQALGHTVKLMPPSYVKAYLKRSKNDANDAAAICEAVTRPSMRFVAIKTKEQQAALMLHRARQLLVRQRPAGYSMCWRVSTAPSEPRSDRSTAVSWPGTARARRAGGWKRFQASVRSSPLPSSPRSATGRRSDRVATWRRGLGWCPSSSRPAARTSLAGSPSKATDTCGGCWSPARWPSSATRKSTAR